MRFLCLPYSSLAPLSHSYGGGAGGGGHSLPMPHNLITDIITLGEALIDLPSTRSGVSLADAPGFAKVPAGAPGNVAAAAAALGLKAAFVSKVGDDPFGAALTQHFGGLGVDTSHFLLDPSARTGLAFVSVMPGGERDFLFYFDPEKDFALRPDDLDGAWLGATRLLHFGSISRIGEPGRSATREAVRLARLGGALVSYDPNLRPRLWPSASAMRAEALSGLADADIVKISAEELAFLYAEAPEEASAIAHLFQKFSCPRLIAVTDGPHGCRGYSRAGDFADVPGFQVALVDATGAGDSFTAGLLAFLLAQGPDLSATLDGIGALLPDALRYANACGALATTHLGAAPTALNRSAVQALLESSL